LEIGERSAGNRRGRVWGGAEALPSVGLGACPRENFEIYVNTDANFSISKVKFLAFRGPSQYA